MSGGFRPPPTEEGIAATDMPSEDGGRPPPMAGCWEGEGVRGREVVVDWGSCCPDWCLERDPFSSLVDSCNSRRNKLCVCVS